MWPRKPLKGNNILLQTLVKDSRRQSIDKSDFTEFGKQPNFKPQVEKAIVSQQALESIKIIFDKTQNVQEVAYAKHDEIQSKFTDLRDKLNNSFEYLQRIKTDVENIKFSYQSKILEMQCNLLHPDDYLELTNSSQITKEEVTKQIEEVQNKIENVQGHNYNEKEKHEVVTKSYQEALDCATVILKSINIGDYSSFNLANIKQNQ